jgi:hypothetical protein
MARRPKETASQRDGKSDLSQSERFVEAARALDADESGQVFDGVFGKLVPPKPRPKQLSKKSIRKT